MLFVELDLHSVVEFYLGAACISFDLYDLVVGIVVGDVLGDRCRDDSGRNGAVLAIDVGPLALAVELDLVAVFERDFIAFPKIGFFFGKSHFSIPEIFLDELLCCLGQLRNLDRFIVAGRGCCGQYQHTDEQYYDFFHIFYHYCPLKMDGVKN